MPNILVFAVPPRPSEGIAPFELAPEDWPGGPWRRLTVAHTELEPDSEMFHSVSYGWPALMSGLKTLLERRR